MGQVPYEPMAGVAHVIQLSIAPVGHGGTQARHELQTSALTT